MKFKYNNKIYYVKNRWVYRIDLKDDFSTLWNDMIWCEVFGYIFSALIIGIFFIPLSIFFIARLISMFYAMDEVDREMQKEET